MSAPLYLALDIGGTKTDAGIVTGEGKVLIRVRRSTSELRAGGYPLGALIDLGREVISAAGVREVSGVGLALPGPVDPVGSRLLAAPTIPELEGEDLCTPLMSAFGCFVAGENDANACALAESRFGAGAGLSSLVYVTVSTGIGGGVVLDDRIYRGSNGTSAEVGHQVLIPNGGPLCDCGGSGCLEALASGRGIAARARAAGLKARDAEAVADLARAGDPAARQVWEDTALYLGLGLSNVINLFDPGLVVLGGGVSLGAADLLLDSVREVVDRRCMPSLRRRTRIALASLGADLGLLSAAVLVIP